MPPPLDLAGRRFGKLLVLARVGKTGKGGRWLCRCDCGAEEVFPAHRLPYAVYVTKHRSDIATACTNCLHARTCQQCGKGFVSRQYKATCSEECRRLRHREIDLALYHSKRKIEDPDINKRRYRRLLESLEADPEKKAAYEAREKERSRKRQERLRADPLLRAQYNAKARARYTALPESERIAKRQAQAARVAAMSPEERESWLTRRRLITNNWKQHWLRTMRENDPDAYRAFLDRHNTYMRSRWRAARALHEFASIAHELERRSTQE